MPMAPASLPLGQRSMCRSTKFPQSDQLKIRRGARGDPRVPVDMYGLMEFLSRLQEIHSVMSSKPSATERSFSLDMALSLTASSR